MLVNGCKIIDVYANYDENLKTHGDIYSSHQEAVMEHPGEKILHGFYVKPPTNYEGDVPDWFDSYNDAFTYAATEV